MLGILRRLHNRGLEFAEWVVLFIAGGLISAWTGYNLFQLAMYGRFYVIVRRGDDYWAYWHGDASAIVQHGFVTLGIFLFAVTALATALVYPVLIMHWGPSRPGYLSKPPLNIRD